MNFFKLGVAATISLLFATSCSNVEEQVEDQNTQVQVKFTINLENKIDTRTISDGTGTDQLMYAILNEDGSKVIVSKETLSDISNLNDGYSLELSLSKGQTYKAVFWAQNSQCDAYSVSDNMEVTVNYNGMNNDESRDAFFASSEPFKVDNHSKMQVVLKRPFAQINVGANPSEMELIKDLDVNVTKSSTIIKDVANKINLLDGEVNGEVDVTYTAAALPTEKLYVDANNDNDKEAYEYVSMSYILTSPAGSTHEMSFEFSGDNGKSIVLSRGLESVPAKRNWRTNIVGKILTGTSKVTIKIDPEYEEDMQIIPTNTGVYYNVTEDMTISNRIYLLDNIDEGATFASENGQLITANNLSFYGSVWTVVFGEYRGPKYHNYNYVLNNIVCKDLEVSNVIHTHGVYVSIGTMVYGTSTINNCEMTGTTTVADTYFDGSKHDFTPCDVGIPNECDAVFNGGKYGTMFFWEHAVVTLNNVKADRIISLTCNSTKHSQLTLAAGTKVGILDCTQPPKYGSRLTIEEGASVDELNLVSASFESMSIAPGTVKKITYNGQEYTLDELKALNN